MPSGYDAYRRILHPVETTDGPMRWADVAARNSRIAHAGMQLRMIGRAPGTPVPPQHVPDGYAAGSLPGPSEPC